MAYTLLEKWHTGSAVDMNNNFQHVGAGSMLPLGGNSLEATTGAYDLGSDSIRWNNAYINTVNLGSGTVNRCMNMIAEVTLTATASSIEFTGLNGEEDVIYEIIANTTLYTNSNVNLYFNNDSATANYGRQYILGQSIAVSAARETSGKSWYLGSQLKYNKSNVIIYANNNIKLGLDSGCWGVSLTAVTYIIKTGYIWNNPATLTSMKFTGYFNPGTHIELWAKR